MRTRTRVRRRSGRRRRRRCRRARAARLCRRCARPCPRRCSTPTCLLRRPRRSRGRSSARRASAGTAMRTSAAWRSRSSSRCTARRFRRFASRTRRRSCPRRPLLPKLGGPDDELAEHLALPAGLGADARALDVAAEVGPRGARRVHAARARARARLPPQARHRAARRRERHRGDAVRAPRVVPRSRIRTARTPTSSAATVRSSARSSRDVSTPSGSTSRPSELGYWAMIVPPDTRVWPFGRVARLVEMGHKERDLVSYFFELQGRARGRDRSTRPTRID